MQYDLRQRMVDALLDQVGRSKISEHGHAEKLEPAVTPSAHGRLERLGVERMHGEEGRARARDRRGRPLDRRLDVGELGIDEDRAAFPRQLLGERKSATEQKLEPDLVNADAVAERLDQRPRLFDARHIEGDDQPVLGLYHDTNFLAAMASASTTVLHWICCALSLRLPSPSNASIARGTAICCGMTVAPSPISRIWRRCSRLRMAP